MVREAWNSVHAVHKQVVQRAKSFNVVSKLFDMGCFAKKYVFLYKTPLIQEK